MRINAVDMFCGAGGTSSGLYAAADELGLSVNLLAINHWPVAIATHSANHPHAQHLCETLDSVDARKACPGKLHLLVASPECTHHSNAAGGRPKNDQSRAGAWHVVRWADTRQAENIIVENVPEFANWGPLNAKGKPIKSRKGETFQAFLQALRSLGYTVDWRVLNAADYGDPTTRRRLFVLARRGRRGIPWPEPTHSAEPGADLFNRRKPWRTAKELIDWSIPGKSIFNRAKPLAPNTLRRIEAGLRKFCGKELQPFITVFNENKVLSGLSQPLPVVTAGGNHFGLCEPFVLPLNRIKDQPRTVKAPLRTITATSNDMALVEPFLVKYYGSGYGAHSVNEPLDTVVGKDKFGICEPLILGQQSGACARPVSQPVPTISAAGAVALIEPYLVGITQSGRKSLRVHSVENPVPTIVTKQEIALCEPEIKGAQLDIRFRMLQPHELAAAQGFPDDYRFTGTKAEQVKQIGNAVPTNLARALCRAALEEYI